MSENSLRFEITDIEIKSSNYYSYLQILKDKGAPILGEFLLKVDPTYTFISALDPLSRKKIFIFKRNL